MKKYIQFILLAFTGTALAEGPLTPPGPPAPTMKSLQEIWDKIGGLETQNAQLSQRLQGQQSLINQQSVLLKALAAAGNVNLPWQYSQVKTLPIGISDHTLDFDPDGLLGIASCGPALSFSELTPQGWTDLTVDAVSGSWCSLKYSPVSGNPSIAYYDSVNGDLKFATRSGGTWSTEIVESAGDVGSCAALAFDKIGSPSIAYYDLTRRFLRYAVKNVTTGIWTREDVESVGNSFFVDRVAISVSADGKVAVCYPMQVELGLGGFEYQLKVATKTSAWSSVAITQPINGITNLYRDMSISFSPSGAIRGGYRFETKVFAFSLGSNPVEVANVTDPLSSLAGSAVTWDLLDNQMLAVQTNHAYEGAPQGNTLALNGSTIAGGMFSYTYPTHPRLAISSTNSVAISYFQDGQLRCAYR